MKKKTFAVAFYSHSYITVYIVPISVSGSVSASSVRMRMDGHIIINILKLMTLTLTSPVACSRCIVHGMSSNCHNHILIKLQAEQATLQLRKFRPYSRQFLINKQERLNPVKQRVVMCHRQLKSTLDELFSI